MCTFFAADYKVEIAGGWANFYSRCQATAEYDTRGYRITPEWSYQWSLPVPAALELFGKVAKHHAAEKRRAAFIDPGVA